MTDDMTHPVTRGELKEELSRFRAEMRAEMRAELEPYATKAYVHEVAQTLLAQMQRTDERLQKVERTLDGMEDRIVDKLSVELARHARASAERNLTEMRAMMDPHRDHPERIAKLERAVFPEDGGVRAKARVRRRTSKR